MSVARPITDALTGDGLRLWLPVFLRGVVALMLLPAGASKFLRYGSELATFTEYGVPAAGFVVILAGVLELVAATAIALGAAGRAAALAVVALMLAAIAFAGVAASNVAILLTSLGIAALGPGKYAVWKPEAEIVERLSRALSGGT